MVVLPTAPVAGETVTASVTPLTLPVAGSDAGPGAVVAVVAWVVDGVAVELEQPARTGAASAARAAVARVLLREWCIGSSYCRPVALPGHAGRIDPVGHPP
jgi:hypothetical protein